VTHEMSFARNVSNRVVFVEAGRIAADGPPAELFGTGGSERFRAFVGSTQHH
jgi:ABC-type histidine transport system ATPase subunit